MERVYSAQNVAAHIIYELQETNVLVNQKAIQSVLAEIANMWQKVFGHSPFKEATHDLSVTGYTVQEVYEDYKQYGNRMIQEPAKEWFLQYGEFQLIQRTYGVPAFTALEKKIIQSVLRLYASRQALRKAS